MTRENRISEMMAEMEKTFAERDALYKEWEELCDRRMDAMKEREQAFENERKAFEKEKQDTEEMFREEQLRLNLLQSNLQNDQIRQQNDIYRFEDLLLGLTRLMADNKEEPALEAPDLKEIRDLKAENETLQEKIEEMKGQEAENARILEELTRKKEELERECTELQEQKKDLFKKLLASDDVIPEPEEDVEYTPPEAGEKSCFEEFLNYFRDKYPSETTGPFLTEEGREGIRLETEEYMADIIPGQESYMEIKVPVEDNRNLRKAIHRINGECGMECRYDRAGKKAVIKIPFQEEDGPEDVANLLRCILDYEVSSLREKGGGE